MQLLCYIASQFMISSIVNKVYYFFYIHVNYCVIKDEHSKNDPETPFLWQYFSFGPRASDSFPPRREPFNRTGHWTKVCCNHLSNVKACSLEQFPSYFMMFWFFYIAALISLYFSHKLFLRQF